MKRRWKVLSLVLVVAMIVGAIPTTTFMSSASGADAEACTAAYYETNGVTSKLKLNDIAWLDTADTTNPLTLYGLLPQEGAPYARMDLTTAEEIAGSTTFSKTSVYSHARESAGGRIRFTTTSSYIALQAEFPLYANDYATGMGLGKYGFDVYVENTETGSYEYYGTLGPEKAPSANAVWGYEDIVEFDDESPRNVMIYFPITNEVSKVYVGLKDSSYVVDSETEYNGAAPIVYYGSSITQGGMSTKPGNTYVNTIGRMLNYDYVNLGVWGSCKAETAFANYIANLQMSAFVFDYDHNESDATVLANKHYAFYQIVREKHPNIPIIFVTRPDSQTSGLHLETKAVIQESYNQAVAAGDNKVYFIDGESFFDYDAAYLHDGVHPTDEGQAKMAEVIGAKLAEVLPVVSESLNETVVLQDTFDEGTAWKTTDRKWKYDDAQYAGARTGVAELGYNNIQSRNYYNVSMTDGHLKATVRVKTALCQSSKPQYHMLFARGGADGSGSISFGFKIASGASKMSLVLCEHQRLNNDQTPVYYETSATYNLNTDYELELFVVGNVVIAKCDGKVIYADEIEGIATSGYWGILDKRAGDGTETTVKAGYFDDFSLSSIAFDSAQVAGPIICNPNGVGVADIKVYSGNVAVASLEDMPVTVAGYSNKIPSKYVAPVSVTCGEKTWSTGINQEIYVVSDITQAVTSITDSRWSQLNSAGNVANPTWNAKNGNGAEVYGDGKISLAANHNNYLTMNAVANKKSSPYSNFYAEYTLTIDQVSGVSASNASFDTRYFTQETSNTTDGAIGRISCTNGAVSASMVRASGSYAYTNQALTGLSTGENIKIGIMVYDGLLSYYVNDTLVGTMTMGSTQGWLIFKNNKPAEIVATIDDFIYVPIPEKQCIDFEVSCASKVEKGKALATTVLPVYSWPSEDSGAVTEGVTVSDFDNTKLGVQQATITFGGISKKVETEVVDYEIQHAEDFLDFDASEWSAASPALTTENGKLIMQATSGELALYGHEQKDGYMEATFAIADSEALTSGTSSTVYPFSIIYRHKGASAKTTIETRVKCLKDSSGNIVGSLECLVRTNNAASTVSATKIQGFEFGKQYTLKLTCIGNYFEVEMNDHVYYQKTIAKNHGLATNSDIRFYISNAANSGTVKVDNLIVADYETYTISESATVELPTYPAANTSEGSYEKTSYLANEEIEVNVKPGEGQQLKVGGLYYTEVGSETKYSVTKRAAEPGENPEKSNTFLLNMPANNISLTDEYYTLGSPEANIGINGVSIRQAAENVKAALRFTSRVYKTYNDGTTDYTLKEVGTMLFKQSGSETTVDANILNECYNNENGVYMLDDAVYGKKVKATKVQDICDEFVDYGLYLTYSNGSTLGNQNYIVYTYAVYEDADGQTVIKFSNIPVTYSYNSVATLLGYNGL